MAIFLAVLCALSYGSGDFFGGLASKRIHPLGVGWVAHGLVVGPITLAAMFVGSAQFDRADIFWGSGGGLSGAFGLLLLYFGLGRGPMSVVAPITALVAAAFPVVFGAIRGERPATLQWVGIFGSLIAIFVMSTSGNVATESSHKAQPLTLAASFGAGFGFGLFFIALDQTGDESGLWPLAFGRMTSFVVFSALIFCMPAMRRRVRLADLKFSMPSMGAAASFDLVANVFYLFAVRQGLLSIVSVISSLYPASTVVLAGALLHEKLTRLQIIGMVCAVASVVLVAAG